MTTKIHCKLKFQCTKAWDELKPTSNETDRYCSECRETVHFIETPEDYQQAQKEKWCISFVDSDGKIWFGEPNVDEYQESSPLSWED